MRIETQDNGKAISHNQTAFRGFARSENMSIEELFRLVKKPLNLVLSNIKKLKTGERKFDTVRTSFLNSLKVAYNEADQQEKYLRENLVMDHLVIAFFGETNAGKSTIIDTFRIIFDERTRRNALEEINKGLLFNNGLAPNEIGVDGTIVGDGRSDFTKTYDEYDMNIDGHKFTLIDVPGIEGNEAEYKDGIKKALQKAHCVFYVHGSDKKPNTKTTEKIKEYLNDWVGVYSIRNIRGGSEQYDEDEDRETLLNEDVLRASQLSENEFKKILGSYYRGNINLQGLLALCSKANFSPTRKDLMGIQSDLLEDFGDLDSVYTFSHFEDAVNEVRKMTIGYKEIIAKSNKDKALAVARKSISIINNCISQQKEAIAEIDSKLKTFERNISATTNKAKIGLSVEANGLIEKELDIVRTALYQAIDTRKEDIVRAIAEGQRHRLERELTQGVQRICLEKTNWYIKEINRLKRDLDTTTNLGNTSISMDSISIGIDTNTITDKMQDFDFGKAINIAMSVAGISMLIPGVGWVLGGIFTLAGALLGGIFGNDGRSEAKRKVDSAIDDLSTGLLSQLNNGVLNNYKHQYELVLRDLKSKISMEQKNIRALRSDIESLKKDIRITISQIRE
nr:GTPase [uncultured Porphyromonas sp.]